ncbi:RNA polymerase-binding protein DksA [Helicobacter kayseriensis]|uniref:RNA polymerase-binding protein DksA n=1 Tax=Helicobacter kayseriensis TaxID=2905877 RepID=UPI001E524B23|nr:RNA polymerase-binding protein DksA [Helicobacter kayseriensis]MCE3047771.1 RNA polymerase-binding protein DksA [Helicobacter kayseriensis]MCE3049130.1 RNA polymerase-binding protein DksA [Helicobacter kayseriensis]
MERKTLEKFKKTLEERLSILESHIAIANDSLLEINHQTHGDQADMISANSQGMLNASLLHQYEVEAKAIQSSLQKIENGLFGICEMCGDDIDENRLWVKPHAQYCIICREIYEKSM